MTELGLLVRRPRPPAGALVDVELQSYCVALHKVDMRATASACPGWSVHDVTAHLASTVERFLVALDGAQAGDLRPPFPRGSLDEHNARSVATFAGDPVIRLRAACDRLVRNPYDAADLVGHIFGPVSIGLLVEIVVFELTLHHADIEPYRPAFATVAALDALCAEVLHQLSFPARDWPGGDDPWLSVLVLSGRSAARGDPSRSVTASPTSRPLRVVSEQQHGAARAPVRAPRVPRRK